MIRNCDVCGIEYLAKLTRSKYCTPRCRQRALRAPGLYTATRATVTALPEQPGPLEAATLSELTAGGRQSTTLGIAVLILARAIESGTPQTGSALAALIREQRAALEAALEGAKTALDPGDELMRRRAERIRNQLAINASKTY